MSGKKTLARVANRLLKPLGIEIIKRKDESHSQQVSRSELYPENPDDGLDPDARRVINVMRYTTTSGKPYDAQDYALGYHSTEIGGKHFRGQRSPIERLAPVPFDFNNKNVLDIGCNQGGMLFTVADKISYGVGVDFDSRMVNAANRVCSYRDIHNLDFYVFDLESEDLDYCRDFIQTRDIDIVFLLSVCMWIENWTQLIDWVANITSNVLFETNGSPEQQQEQELYLAKRFRKLVLVADESADDQGQKFRKLILCSN